MMNEQEKIDVFTSGDLVSIEALNELFMEAVALDLPGWAAQVIGYHLTKDLFEGERTDDSYERFKGVIESEGFKAFTKKYMAVVIP